MVGGGAASKPHSAEKEHMSPFLVGAGADVQQKDVPAIVSICPVILLMLFVFSNALGQIGPGCSQTITNFKRDVVGPQQPVENPYQSFCLA